MQFGVAILRRISNCEWMTQGNEEAENNKSLGRILRHLKLCWVARLVLARIKYG